MKASSFFSKNYILFVCDTAAEQIAAAKFLCEKLSIGADEQLLNGSYFKRRNCLMVYNDSLIPQQFCIDNFRINFKNILNGSFLMEKMVYLTHFHKINLSGKEIEFPWRDRKFSIDIAKELIQAQKEVYKNPLYES